VRFQERVAVVTGAAGAIGWEVSRRLASEGCRVVLADLDPDALRDRSADYEREFGNAAVAVDGDLADRAVADRLIGAAREVYGRLDVLVNNAGGGIILPTAEHTPETIAATIARNLSTAINCTLAALPGMREAGYGRVVFIGADSVRNGLDRHAIYNAAKGGVHAMTRGLAREYAREGLTFNVVAPSAVLTPELEGILAEQPEVGEAFVRVIPVGRPASMAEVASAVAYLASEEASFITGQVLSVNGGSTMG
jgi:2,3-dihydroxy-2,3-dihydro-p-cumate dehydrogenase